MKTVDKVDRFIDALEKGSKIDQYVDVKERAMENPFPHLNVFTYILVS